jgi:foldase protein PrsA
MMLKKIEAAQFPSAAARHAFLAASGETPADLRYRVRIDYLSNRIRARVQDAPVTITPAQVMAYYVANTSRHKRPQRRDVRIVRVASAAQAAHVRALLASGRPLRLVAGRYSLDAASRKHGGLLIGVVRGDHARALDAAIFTAPVGRLVGPVKTPTGYDVFRVEKITPARTETLAEATPGITTLLTAQARDAALRTFVAAFNAKWTARTTCAPGYVVPDCANAPAAAPTTSALSLQAVAHVDASRASTHGGVRR